MLDRFTDRARKVMSMAKQEALDLHSNKVGTEHLLLGLMREENGLAHTVLTEAGLTPELLEEITRRSVGAGFPGGNPAQGLTPRARRVVEIAVEDAVRELDAIITAEHCKPKERMSILAE